MKKRCKENGPDGLGSTDKVWHDIIMKAPDIIMVIDRASKIRFINRIVPGLTLKQVIGKKIYDFIEPKYLKIARRAINYVLQTGKNSSYVIQGTGPKKSKVFYETNLSAIKHKGKVISIISVSRDITEKKKAEEELQSSEERFRTIFNGANEGILVADIKTKKFIMANQAICRFLGYKKKELLKLSVMDIHPKKDLKNVISQFMRQARGELEVAENLPCLRKDRKIVYADIATRAVKINDRLYNVGFFRDVTERRKAEEQVRNLTNYLQLQIERMPIGLIVWNPEFRVKTWNPAAKRIFGFSKKEAMGKHPYDLIVPKKIQHSIGKIWSRLLKGDKTAHSVNENTTKSGKTILCMWSNTPLKEEDGTVIGVLSMVQDITEKKKAEEELAKRLEELETFKKFAIGRELKMIGLKKRVRKLERQQGIPAKKDEKKIKKPGTGEDALYNIMEDLNEANKKILKEKKSVEKKVKERTRELQEANEGLKALDKAKEEFISMVSHELKTPLFPIMGYIDLLLKGRIGHISRQQKEKLTTVYRCAEGLNRLVDDMLDMSRLELKRAKLDMGKNDIVKIAREVKDSHGLGARNAGMAIKINAPGSLVAYCDRKRIAQVINNFLDNAIKFNKKNGKVEVSIKEKAGKAIVSVKDIGIGITKENQKQLFGRFFQVKRGAARQFGGGTGLGLAICKGIIKLHHGQIWVKSAPGKGSVFTFTLPLKRRRA